jgi:hypothetical protein
LASLAASTSSDPRASAYADEAAEEADVELLPQPTDPDRMRAVAAAPREPQRAQRLPATDATTPSHAINPGSIPAGTVSATGPMPPAAAASGDGAPSARAKTPQPSAALSGELQLLAQAQRALHDGKLSLALTLLDQHSRQHAQGSLVEERLAARAVVLCRLHQPVAGNTEAQRLAALTPRSPLLPWVRSACAER